VESNHHSRRRRGYSPLSSPNAQRPHEAPTRRRRYQDARALPVRPSELTGRHDRSNHEPARTRGDRPGSNRRRGIHSPGCFRSTPRPPRRGRRDSNPRPFARQATALAAELHPQIAYVLRQSVPRENAEGDESRVVAPAEPARSAQERARRPRPQGARDGRSWRGWDSNPRSRAHEAREDSLSSTALRDLAGWSRTSDLRRPKPAGWPSPLQPVVHTPGGNRTRASGLRVRRHCRSTTGACQSEVLESNQALLGISEPCPQGHLPPKGSGGRARTCLSRVTVARLTDSTTPE
jgi:hypothetical protein